MIIGLVGYHSAGKSTIGALLSGRYGWSHLHKASLIANKKVYKEKSAYEIMKALLGIIDPQKISQSILIIDAIHNPGEWKAVKEADPNSILIGVFAPLEVRLARNSEEDNRLDIKREGYWHESSISHCLLCDIEWAFSGIANKELLDREIDELYTYLIASKRIKF